MENALGAQPGPGRCLERALGAKIAFGKEFLATPVRRAERFMSRVYSIGRGPGSDIPIQDVSVSREHAQLAFTDDGRCHLRDCDSTYGTFVFRDGR